jgi:D-alanyl-D-alanine carboxypeptidase/D-alanyl-D-alanine-endopeptidase (penicillin-binding protein 4)
MPATDPALDTVQQLAALLAARGVQISQGVRAETSTPAGTYEIARVESPPLAAIVEQMLTISNNETAELLTRELGVARGGAGTTAAGTRAVRAVLAPLGVPVAGVDLHDGSGLAPDDRVTCDALLRVIDLADRRPFGAIDRGLAIAGRTGTLASRFAGTPLEGRLRATTGHISGVVGLVGVIDGGPQRVDPRFAFVANGTFSTDGGAILQDEIATAIGAYPDAPTPSALVPAPRGPG